MAAGSLPYPDHPDYGNDDADAAEAGKRYLQLPEPGLMPRAPAFVVGSHSFIVL